MSTARALALHEFRAVLHVGLAGARGIEPGSLVVGTEAVYLDLSASWPVVDRVSPDAGLLAAARSVLPGAPALAIHTSAAVGACNSLLQATVVEAMEGFGVLRAAQQAGVPALEVRAISNAIGEEDRSLWQPEPAYRSLEDALPKLLDAVSAH